MIAISSFRQFSESSEIATNQLRAKASWDLVFDHILYFGTEEPQLASPKTEFCEAEDFPHMRLLFLAAALSDDFACILNADIVVAPSFGWHMQEVHKKGIGAITSRRYEFTGENVSHATVVDSGFDFFGAWPQIWQQVLRDCPDWFRIGHSVWDAWLLEWFTRNLAHHQFGNLTNDRLVFHPRHGDRRRPYHG